MQLGESLQAFHRQLKLNYCAQQPLKNTFLWAAAIHHVLDIDYNELL